MKTVMQIESHTENFACVIMSSGRIKILNNFITKARIIIKKKKRKKILLPYISPFFILNKF